MRIVKTMSSHFSRPDWDTYFLGIAQAVSTRATCPRASVGALLVSKDHRLLATGYNGSPPGEVHCFDEGCIVENNHCQRAIHAEVNAIAFAARWGVSIENATLYIYDTQGRDPCGECTKVIKAAGVHYWKYRGLDSRLLCF